MLSQKLTTALSLSTPERTRWPIPFLMCCARGSIASHSCRCQWMREDRSWSTEGTKTAPDPGSRKHHCATAKQDLSHGTSLSAQSLAVLKQASKTMIAITATTSCRKAKLLPNSWPRSQAIPRSTAFRYISSFSRRRRARHSKSFFWLKKPPSSHDRGLSRPPEKLRGARVQETWQVVVDVAAAAGSGRCHRLGRGGHARCLAGGADLGERLIDRGRDRRRLRVARMAHGL